MRIKPILLVSPLPPPNGGIATWTQKIMHYGLPTGHPITLVNTRIRGKRSIFDNTPLSLMELWRNICICFMLLWNLICKRPRLVHINSALSPIGIVRDLFCMLLAKSLAIPAIVQFHGNLPDFNPKRLFGVSGIALKSLIRLARLNIVINEVSLLRFAEQNQQSKVSMLPNFIEDHLFAEKISRQLTEKIRAVFVGGITRTKGCVELFTAAQKFPDLEIHLFGKMHDDMANEPFPHNVKLHGETPHEALIQILPNYHFLIFPSYSEGFPLTVLEAMTCGLPVIATKVGAIPQMIDADKGGILFEPRDTQSLSLAIETMLNSQTKFETMGAYNRNKCFQSYRYSKVVKDLMRLYNTIG